MNLPPLTDEETAVLHGMRALLAQQIAAAGGALPFDRYMESALYAPGLGYYVNGRSRFGEAGDFVTAPEVSPLFGRCLANQVAECLERLHGGAVLELGAGSGRMAADILAELAVLDALPERYLILEPSPDLRQTQHERLRAVAPQLLERVEWLERLPAGGLRGVLLANEVLDAMPVHGFRRHAGGWQELVVAMDDSGLHDRWVAPRSPGLEQALQAIWPDGEAIPDGYRSEINLRLAPWLAALAAVFEQGYALLIDYGYTRAEYYHPERAQGTLICHFRHRAYADPYLLPGLQDITANVDFTAVAQAAREAGFVSAGFTTQAHFLIDAGLDRLLAASDPTDVRCHLELMQGVKTLTLPSEMGERFKVLALARATQTSLSGFRTRDLSARL